MKNILYILTLFCTISVFGQEDEDYTIRLIPPDDSWRQEVIPMPLGFAPQIPVNGIEEVLFAKGWSTKGDDTFWTYAFLWNVNQIETLTINQLELYMQYYFDGLMTAVNKDKDKVVPKTEALFLKKEAGYFVGKIQLYDAFHTKDIITLNCTVMQYQCPKTKKSMVLFHFSPKEFGHATWNKLHTVKLKENPCEE
ncbi:hypothetical protein [uncultured Kordia sp.]|uniref:hypothetical protein n=1 Tax=uncultured Kordia sp. TaxID=507699 RepID=UPI00261A8571|nr:hypothetical protein [uncultured Kordia sp.]